MKVECVRCKATVEISEQEIQTIAKNMDVIEWKEIKFACSKCFEKHNADMVSKLMMEHWEKNINLITRHFNN